MKTEEHYSLQHLNTFRLAVKTRHFIEYENEHELAVSLRDAHACKLSILPIGQGSNLLFLKDFDGIVLHSAIKGITLIAETDENVLLRVGAAEIWDDVVQYAVEQGWGGIENLSLIPGETGAAAVQNIGAYGMEIKDVVETIEAISTVNYEKRTFLNADCKYDYRSSIFKNQPTYVITHVTLRLQKKPVFHLEYGNLKAILGTNKPVTLQKIREAAITIRREKLPDPNELGNAGSFFMNPIVRSEKLKNLIKDYPSIPYYPAKDGFVKISAGWLIEQCGLKGKRFGQVGVYGHQALVIVNYGGATGYEIAQIADYIRETVYLRFDVQLVPEVKYINCSTPMDCFAS